MIRRTGMAGRAAGPRFYLAIYYQGMPLASLSLPPADGEQIEPGARDVA